MNCLYARSNSKFHLVLSGDKCPDLFIDIDLAKISSIAYSHTASLEEDEWFSIVLSKSDTSENDDEKISDPLERLSRQINTTLPNLEPEQYNDVKYFIFQPDGKKWFFLQKILSGSKVYRKRFLTWSDQPEILQKPLIIINEQPDALYNYETNTLYFKKLEKLNSIFSNINSLYREATQEEIDTFLSIELIHLHEDFKKDKVSIVNRKHIAAVLEIYNQYDDAIKEELHTYIDTKISLPKDSSGKYIIDNDKNLRQFIYALQERYYTTPATQEDRLAQSFIPT